ncbi:MAG: hypothetical protein GYA17_08865 [Chloroflexi bacterium]|nr:hypothetical protein [Anaerolineaceae bacterium]NMB88458.1 hypothetical protein [Chloroflexota bacterium]
MSLFKKIWNDIKRGENIDLYVTVVVAFGIGIASSLGYANQSVATGITLAALGILTSSALRDKHAYEESTKKTQQTQDMLEKIIQLSEENSSKISIAQSTERKITNSLDSLIDKLLVSDSICQAGLDSITMQARNIDWDHLFEKVDQLDVFFTYARTWRSTNSNLLDQFIHRKDTRLRVVLPDPENEVILQELAHRFSKSPGEFQNLIAEASRDYTKMYETASQNGAVVELWYASVAPMFTLYRFDKLGILALGSYKDTKGDVPHFLVSEGGTLYKYILEEFNTLIATGERSISRRIF